MIGRDLLNIPRRRLLGRVLGRWAAVSWISKFLRVGRKRFIARIKGPERASWIAEILSYPAGRDFHHALETWARSASIPTAIPPLAAVAESLRCSVIINTVDRASDLEITLAALAREWDAARDELIVVLGPTGDDSEEIVARSPMPCRLIPCPVRNLAVSRNLGLAASSARFVAFIDDDASPSPGWLDTLLQPLEKNPKTAISAGFVLDGQGAHFLNRYVVADTLGRAFWFDDSSSAATKIAQLGSSRAFLTATGCNMAFRRSALITCGGFDPFYQYFLEETDLIRRLLDHGHRCEISPASTVLHRLGANLARTPSFDPADRAVIIRSQIHYIGKFGKATFSPAEIESCLWQRVLLDLEKIAWDCSHSPPHDSRCSELQQRYLAAVAAELRLDSLPDSSSFSHPVPT